MSSQPITQEQLARNMARLKKKIKDTLRAREERLARGRKEPQLPSFVKKVNEEKDHEHSMARSEIHKISKAIQTIRKKIKGEGNLEAWVQSKITRAADYLDAASNYLESGEHNNIEEACDDMPELRSRTITKALSSSGERRKPRKSPGELMRMLNQGNTPVKPKKKKKKKKVEEEYIYEKKMTEDEMEKEEQLKDKYDKSEMKANMIAKYGKEKGLQVYFATIRKQAMKGDEDINEMKVRKFKEGPVGVLSKMLRDVRLNRDISRTKKGIEKTEKRIPRQLLSASFAPEELDEAKLSRTERRQRNIGKRKYDETGRRKPTGRARFWDMDETLMRNDPSKIRVHVHDQGGKRVKSLTNQEFNTHKLDPGHKYDFGEFRSSERFSQASTPNKSMVKKLKKQVRRMKPVHIITARADFDDQPKLAKHLRRKGIEINPGQGKGRQYVHFHRAGNLEGSDIGEKKVRIAKGIMQKTGSKSGEMYDDAAKVHKAFKKDNVGKPISRRIKPMMVQPNKRGITQARSFREEIGLEELYDFLLESLIETGYAETYDDASDILEEFADEELVEILNEAATAVAAPAPNDRNPRKIKKSYKNIGYKSPYPKNIKKEYTQEQVELTPYEYWKSIMMTEDEDLENEYDNLEEEDDVMTSYDFWKAYLELMETAKDPRTPSQIRKQAMLKKLMDLRQKQAQNKKKKEVVAANG